VLRPGAAQRADHAADRLQDGQGCRDGRPPQEEDRGAVDDVELPTFDGVLDRLSSDEAVETLLGGLAQRDRRIIEAMLADVPDEALAHELDIESNALYVARHRALGRLRSQIEATG
jgi:DNA-directed RNA polymerase specialized sigma24 family protein